MNCPKCGSPAYIEGNSACYNCRNNLVLETARPTLGFVDLHRLDMLAARWREEAVNARAKARITSERGRREWLFVADRIDKCVADLEAEMAGSGHIAKLSGGEPEASA